MRARLCQRCSAGVNAFFFPKIFKSAPGTVDPIAYSHLHNVKHLFSFQQVKDGGVHEKVQKMFKKWGIKLASQNQKHVATVGPISVKCASEFERQFEKQQPSFITIS